MILFLTLQAVHGKSGIVFIHARPSQRGIWNMFTSQGVESTFKGVVWAALQTFFKAGLSPTFVCFVGVLER